MTTFIGLAGYRGSGKTTLARNVAQHYHVRHASFASPLRVAAAAAWGIPEIFFTDRDLKDAPIPGTQVTPRQALIQLGTDYYRNQVDPNHWVRNMKRRFEQADIVLIDDVRFLNEAAICDVLLHVNICEGEAAPEDEPELERVLAKCSWLITGDYPVSGRQLVDACRNEGVRILKRRGVTFY